MLWINVTRPENQVSADSVLTACDRKYSLKSLHELTYRETSSPHTPFLHKCKIVIKCKFLLLRWITKYHINLTNIYNLFLPQNKNCCFICRFFNCFKTTDLNYLYSNITYYLLPFCVLLIKSFRQPSFSKSISNLNRLCAWSIQITFKEILNCSWYPGNFFLSWNITTLCSSRFSLFPVHVWPKT